MNSALRTALDKALARIKNKDRLQEIKACLEPDQGLDGLEQAVEKLLGISGIELFEAELQNIADRADAPFSEAGAARCPQCGRVVSARKRMKRKLSSTVGPVSFSRVVWRCTCGHGFAPADPAIGIKPGSKLTPFMERISRDFGIQCTSFAKARQLMAITLETPATCTIQNKVAAEGQEVIHAQADEIEQVKQRTAEVPRMPDPATNGDTVIIEVDGGLVPCCPAKLRAVEGDNDPCEAAAASAPTTVTANESVGDPVDEEGIEREALQRKRPGTSHREVKVGAVYLQRDREEIRSRKPDRPSRGKVKRLLTTVRLAHWSIFAWHLFRLAMQAGADAAKRVVILGDGAEWIDDIRREFFPESLRILDFWHAMEHIAKAGRHAFGKNTPAFHGWLREQRVSLREGRLDAVLSSLRALDAAPSEVIAKVTRYLEKRRAYMDYPRYEALGLPIASGLIEGRVKHLKQRADAGSQRWLPDHVEAVLALRSEAENQPHFKPKRVA